VAACLEVGFDARTGTVTAKVVDPRDARPIPLRAEPLDLYAPFEPAASGAWRASETEDAVRGASVRA
jgi:hypothetical protein